MLSNLILKNLTTCSSVVILTAAYAMSTSSVFAVERNYSSVMKPSTGFNSMCDQALFSLPAPLPADVHFDFVGLYNPDSPTSGEFRDGLPLQQSDCVDSLNVEVASHSYPNLLAVLGAPYPDPRLKNLRTNEIPKIIAPDGTRATLLAENSSTPPFPSTNNATNEAMTLHDFNRVKGKFNLKCLTDGTAIARIKLQNYQPNELLTIWGIWLATPPGELGPRPVAVPFGGVPNVITVNHLGRGRLVRTLNYCPLDIQPNGEQLMMLDIASHLDGNTYGGAPGTPQVEATFIDPSDPESTFTSFLSEGIVTVLRGAFPVTVDAF